MQGFHSVPLQSLDPAIVNTHEAIGRAVCDTLNLVYFPTNDSGGCVRLVEASLQAIRSGYIASEEQLRGLQNDQPRVLHLLSEFYNRHAADVNREDFAYAIQQFSAQREEHFSTIRNRDKWGLTTEPAVAFGIHLLLVNVATPNRWQGGFEQLTADVTVHTGQHPLRYAVLVTSINNNPGHVTLVWA